MMPFRAVLLAAIISLAGCQTTPTLLNDTTARAIAVAEQTLTALERAALVYTSLPACGGTLGGRACADPSVKAAIKRADQTAYDAVTRVRRNQGTIDAALTALDLFRKVIPGI